MCSGLVEDMDGLATPGLPIAPSWTPPRLDLIALPLEVLINVLGKLQLLGLLACGETCTALRDLIADSSYLRHRKESLAYGFQPRIRGPASPSEELARLRKSEAAWRTLSFVSKPELIVYGYVKRTITLQTHVYCLVVPYGDPNPLGVPDAFNPMLGLPPTRFIRINIETLDLDDEWHVPLLPEDSAILDFVIDESQDLLLWMEARPLAGADFSGERRTIWMHSVSLSSATLHPDAPQNGPTLVTLTKHHSEMIICFGVGGDHASMIVTPNMFLHAPYGILVLNWKTGQRLHLLQCGDAFNRLRCMFVVDRNSLLTLWRDSLEILSFSPEHPSETTTVSLLLPPLYHWADRQIYTMSSPSSDTALFAPSHCESDSEDAGDPNALITLVLVGVDKDVSDWRTFLLTFSRAGLLTLAPSPEPFALSPSPPPLQSPSPSPPQGVMIPWETWSALPGLRARLLPLKDAYREVVRSHGNKVLSLANAGDRGWIVRLREFGRYAVGQHAEREGRLGGKGRGKGKGQGRSSSGSSAGSAHTSARCRRTSTGTSGHDSHSSGNTSSTGFRSRRTSTSTSTSTSISTSPSASGGITTAPNALRHPRASFRSSSSSTTTSTILHASPGLSNSHLFPPQPDAPAFPYATVARDGRDVPEGLLPVHEFEVGPRGFVQYARSAECLGYSRIKIFSTV